MMVNFDTVVQQALNNILREGLKPFVLQELETHSPDWWSVCVEPVIKHAGKSGAIVPSAGSDRDRFSYLDTALLLKTIVPLGVELKDLPNWRRIFSSKLNYEGNRYVTELLDVRNRFAHQSDKNRFDARDAHRALDTMARLLQLVGDTTRANEINQIASEIMQPTFVPAPGSPKSDPVIHVMPFPVSVGDFVGRLLQLNSLKVALTDGQRGVIIWGSGGIGKTTLATRLAEILKPHYPDAQIYLDLRGGGVESPLSVSDIAAAVIQSIERQNTLPDNESALIGLYRRVAFEKNEKNDDKEVHALRRTLLFMDNAANQQQIETLVPPTGSVMIVTSRQYFPVRGFYSLELGSLAHDEAIELLKRIAPHLDEAQADAIATLCDDYPFALDQAGGYLASEIDLDPSHYLQQLRVKPSRRVDLIANRLRTSFEALSAGEQQLWCGLAVFSGAFTADAVAAIWNMDLAITRQNLTPLVKRSLVKHDRNTKRYRLHDLHREFIYSQMNSTEETRLRRSHAFYYLDAAITDIVARYYGDDEAEQQALEQFEWDWPNYQVAWDWASQHADADKSVANLCYHYLDVGWYLIIRRQPSNEWIQWIVRALMAAKQSGDSRTELRLTYRLATAYEAAYDYARATTLYERALELARSFAGPHSLSIVLRSLGKSLVRDFNLHHIALHVANVILNCYGPNFRCRKVVWDLAGIPDKIAKLSDVWVDSLDDDPCGLDDITTGEFDVARLRQQSAIVSEQCQRAVALLAEAVQTAHTVGDEWNELEALVALSETYADLGELSEAITLAQRAIIIAKEANPDRASEIEWGLLGECYVGLGHHFLYSREPQRAIENYECFLGLFPHAENFTQADVLAGLARAYLLLGEPRKASDYISECGAFLSDQLNEDWKVNDALYWQFGTMCEEAGYLEEAIRMMQGCLDWEIECEDPEALSHLWQLGLVCEKAGHLEQALDRMSECVEMELEAERPEAGKHMAYLESRRVQWQSLHGNGDG